MLVGAALFMALCPLSALLTSELTGDEASVSPPVTFQEKFNGARHDGMKALNTSPLQPSNLVQKIIML